jgi:hypothetical protein
LAKHFFSVPSPQWVQHPKHNHQYAILLVP